jgi:hypothetical protein
MKTLLTLLCLGIASTAVLSSASAAEAESKKPGVERIVVPMEGVTEFTVTGRSTLFRLAISTISGGTIGEPKIDGNARLIRTAEIINVDKDGQPLIGAFNKEFVFRGTAAGRVTIEIKKTLPTQPTPVVEKFTVTIK